MLTKSILKGGDVQYVNTENGLNLFCIRLEEGAWLSQ